MYALGDPDPWKGIGSMIPGHNQRCERLIGDLKHFHDVNTIVSVMDHREERPRTKGHVNKSL